ncbi:sugar ABC transporter substrate-binding protein [Catellatospora chokoriensis]|nr:extracellular solute-binding protein [Catellatospora chokoriensis]
MSMDAMIVAAAPDGVWGDVPSWVAAVATVFALAFAAVAAQAALRTYRIESERDRVDAESRRAQDDYLRRTQAALVSAWWGESPDQPGVWGAHLRNASGAPVYQVYCTVVDADDDAEERRIHHPVVPPGTVAQFSGLVRPAEVPVLEPVRRVKVSFTDSAGIRWLRDQYGRLIELQPTLRVKADRARTAVLTRFEAKFRATYGVTVAFEVDPEGHPQDAFMADVRRTDVADALVCPHDWIGVLARDRVIEPVVLSAEQRSAFAPWTLDSLVHEGRLYGVPTTMDTTALLRNTELAPHAPATFEELVAMGEELLRQGRVSEVFATRIGDRGDPFQTWPVFTSAGGWLFGRDPDGSWNPGEVGLDSPGSVAAFECFRMLGEQGMLRRGVDRLAARRAFSEGRTAFLLTSSDGLQEAQAAKIRVSVSAMPPFAQGLPARTFSLVHGLTIAREGANSAIAHDLFADFLTHGHVMTALSQAVHCPVALLAGSGESEAVQQYRRLCEVADPMPTFAFMRRVWDVLGEAQADAVAGARGEVVGRRAAAAVRDAVRDG